MAGWIWGQTRDLDDRTFGPVDLTKPRPDARCYQGTRIWGQARYHGDRHNAGYTRYGDRHDVRYTDQERSTSNVQLATFNGRDRKEAWRVGYGDRHGVWATCRANRGTGTVFGPGGRIFDTSELTQRPVGRSNRAAAPRYGDRHDVRRTDRERSTSNAQLSTFNGVAERAHGGRDMGTDTKFARLDFWSGGHDRAPAGPSGRRGVLGGPPPRR